MSVKDTARKQYVRIIDRAAEQLSGLQRPAEGWLKSLRQALGMSGAQVATRMGVTRAAVYQAERNERDDAITLSQLHKVADAMGCELVYAIVPKGSVSDVIREQALRKAEARVNRVGAHMALEQQSLSNAMREERIEELAEQLIRDMPSDFWEVK